MRKLFEQIIKFGIVGVIATVIDWIIFYTLFNAFGVWYILAKFIAFVIATIFNYYLSMKYVFVSKYSESEKGREFQLFVLLSIIGMLITLALLWFTVEILGIDANYANIMVAVVVMCINFAMRKIWLEQK